MGRRQIIVITHNSTLVVDSDSETIRRTSARTARLHDVRRRLSRSRRESVDTLPEGYDETCQQSSGRDRCLYHLREFNTYLVVDGYIGFDSRLDGDRERVRHTLGKIAGRRAAREP